MYSPIIVKGKLDAVQNSIDKREKKYQFNLTAYSVEQSRYMVDLLQSRISLDGKVKTITDLTQAEQNFISNERILCMNDFMYWVTHYAHIKSTLTEGTDKVILFYPNIPQQIIIKVWAQAEEQHHAIMMLYDKARQLGVSTINELAIAHRVQFYPRTNALVASSDPDKTKKMAEMMKLAWEQQPFWLVPEFKILSSKEIWAVFETKASVTCQHGTAMSGIARGDTPDIAHLSELSDYRDPAEDVDASLLNAIHESPSTFIVLESTAKGKTGQGAWWYNKWKYAKKYFPRNKTRLRPVFLPWFAGTDVWPTKTWCHQFLPKPISTWKPDPETIAHATKCAEYVAETPLLREHLGAAWKLPIEQMYFWEFTRNEYKENQKLHKFYEELCASDAESFQRSGRGVISMEQAEWLRNHAKPLANYYGAPAVFGIIGDGIAAEEEPLVSEIDTHRPYITIKVQLLEDEDGKTNERVYRLLPLIHDPETWNNRLFVWEFPFTTNRLTEYALGVDGAEGLEGEGDNSVINVSKKMTLISPAEQVAEFVSDSLSTADLLPYCLAIGTFFSDYSEEFRQCRQVIETAFGGHGLQHQLKLAGWYNFHRWHGAYQSFKRKSTNTIGWETNAWTRPLLVTQSIKAVKDGAYRINSPHMIEELVNLQKDDDSMRIEAKGGEKDDRVFSGFISFFSLHDWELYLMGTGDKRTREMFSSYSEKLPQEEGQIISLNESISKMENKLETPGYSNQIIINSVLPTLD
jgi:hypothetical protein